MKKNKLTKKISYKFDNLMSHGLSAMIVFLGLISLLLILLAGTIIWFFNIIPTYNDNSMSFIEASWQSLMRTLDSGAIGADETWGFRLVGFIVTLGGIFIISTLIGVLNNGIENKLIQLRKGKSFVIEKDFVLILGWSTKIFTIIQELVISNENQKKPRIVILSEKDKVEMEDEIKNKIKNTKNTKIICRNGNPNDLLDLENVNINSSKSIIILAEDYSNSDPKTIKTILAVTNNTNRREIPYHIVAEIKNEKNLEVAKMVGKDEVELILTDDVIGRIMVQTSRQSGLSVVYTELMDFDGDEIYFKEEKKLINKTFSEAVSSYNDSSVIGLQLSNGKVILNPNTDLIIKEGDKIIAITKYNDSMSLNTYKNINIQEEAIVNLESNSIISERILMLGWNVRSSIIIRELDNYLGANSYIKVVSLFDVDEDSFKSIAKNLKNIELEFFKADTTSSQVIKSLDITSYNSIQILCYKDELEIQDSDSHSLITLLHIRKILEETKQEIKVVSEILDLKNLELAQATKADDFIVSDKLISLLMAQVTENKSLMRVFEDLFDAEGSEIYLKPVTDYISLNTIVDFYTIIESANRKNQIAIGYKISSMSSDVNNSFGVVVNPIKSNQLNFNEFDKIIVISEN